jgi:hypothetical protein
MTRPVLYGGAYIKQAVSDIYGYAPMSRTEGGVAIDQIVKQCFETVVLALQQSLPLGPLQRPHSRCGGGGQGMGRREGLR